MMFDFNRYKSNVALITDRGEALTYEELCLEAEKWCSVLPQKGFAFILCQNTIGSFVGYVSCMNGGVPALLLDAGKDAESVSNLIAIYQPDYLWLPAERVHEFGGVTLYSYSDYCLQFFENCGRNKPLYPDLLLCLTTSGSTGSPKLVRLSRSNLESNARSIADYLGIDCTERPVTSLPMYYSFGMSVINSHLICGATVLLTDKTLLERDFWSFVKTNKATSIAGVPYTYEMLKCMRFFKMDLPDLKTMIQAGGKLNPTLVKEYAGFANDTGKRFYVMYGQTEAAPRMSYLPYDKALEIPSSIGIAIPGGAFSLVDCDGRTVDASDIEGELVYSGPNVCLGYAESREDLGKGDENNGVLYTGDMAKRDSDGFYYITGRLKRFVKIWGNRCNLDALEQIVKQVTDECACTGEDDLVTVFITSEDLAETVLNQLVARTGFNPRAFSVRVVPEILKMPSGKTDYRGLRDIIL